MPRYLRYMFSYRGREGSWAWLFHRISGIGIWLFVVLHVIDSRGPLAHATPLAGPHDDEHETRFVLWLKRQFLRLLHLALRRFWWVVGLSLLALAGSLALLPFFGLSFLPQLLQGISILAIPPLPAPPGPAQPGHPRCPWSRLNKPPVQKRMARQCGLRDACGAERPRAFSFQSSVA